MSKFLVLKQLWLFMKETKKWWLLPLLFILVGFGVIMTFAQGSVFAPFIYAIF